MQTVVVQHLTNQNLAKEEKQGPGNEDQLSESEA
jgi:hypothetical protein